MNKRELELSRGIKRVKLAKDYEKKYRYDHAAKEYSIARNLFKKLGQNKLFAQCLVARVANIVKFNMAGRDVEVLPPDLIDSNIKELDEIDKIELLKAERYEIYIKAYRELEKIFRDLNIIDRENEMYYKRMRLYHKLYWEKVRQKDLKYKERLKYFSQCIFRGVLHCFYRHGERPVRALLWLVAIVFVFAAVYKVFNLIEFTDPQKNLCFWQSLYYSVVTFTTLGYGDIVPTCLFGQLLAIFEVVLGILTISLFIPLIIKKLE